MVRGRLRRPLEEYPARLSAFLEKLEQVGSLTAQNGMLWEVMDTVAFQDAEAALETTLFNYEAGPHYKDIEGND